MKQEVVNAAIAQYDKVAKPDEVAKASGPNTKAIMDAIQAAIEESKALDVLLEEAEATIRQAGIVGVEHALDQLSISDKEITDLANERAITYAKGRAAEMVGMRYNEDGDLIPNPRAEWAITDATREYLRADVTVAMEEGWSNQRLASRLEDNYAFSEDRAMTIARTETAWADTRGNHAAWEESGVVEGKQWVTADGCCPECCDLNEEVVGLGESFPGEGADGPPLHPNCRCTTAPVVAAE